MRKSVCVKDDKSNKTLPWLPEFDRLLIAGIKHGPAMKKDAINQGPSAWHRTGRVETAGSASTSCGGPPNGRLLRSATQPRQRSLGKLPQPGGQPPDHGRRRMTTGC